MLFTDGSKLDDGRTGAGWTLWRDGKSFDCGKEAHGKYTEVFDAEAYAFKDGLKAASAYFKARSIRNL